MEEEISYSTVVFKNGGKALKESKEESVYSEVKPKGAATAVQISQVSDDAHHLCATSSVDLLPPPKDPLDPPKTTKTAISLQADGEAAGRSHFCALALSVGILCALLVSSIGAIIYLHLGMNEQRANLNNITAENEKLMVEKSLLEQEMRNMSRVVDNLNRTLRFILKFDTFPVKDYCPGKKCQPCLKDWILFQEKCYLFYNESAPWKTWKNSRKYCQSTTADLVVIDSLREQEFISMNIKFYYSQYHGFWLGLYENEDKNWVWVNGHNDTLGFWQKEALVTPGQYALMIPNKNLTANWKPAENGFLNKFICENDALIRSTQ